MCLHAVVLLRRLQSVLNARVVFSTIKSEHTSSLLREFHWLRLRVPEQINFRLCVLTYRCLHGEAPSYLAETIHPVSCCCTRQKVSSRRSSLGDRVFPVAVVELLTTFSPDCSFTENTNTVFCRELKTVLFRSSFPVS